MCYPVAKHEKILISRIPTQKNSKPLKPPSCIHLLVAVEDVEDVPISLLGSSPSDFLPQIDPGHRNHVLGALAHLGPMPTGIETGGVGQVQVRRTGTTEHPNTMAIVN